MEGYPGRHDRRVKECRRNVAISDHQMGVKVYQSNMNIPSNFQNNRKIVFPPKTVSVPLLDSKNKPKFYRA